MLSRLLLSLTLVFPCTILSAQDDSQQQLENVKTEIQSINKNVNKNKASQAVLFKQLKEQSRQVSNLNKALLNLEQEIKQQNAELQQLEQKIQHQHSSHDEQLKALNRQIRTAFMNGQPSYLKILLNQQSPATLSRSTTYFHYFHQARQQQLVNISRTLNNLSDAQKNLFVAQRAQQQRYTKQQQQQYALQKQTQNRQATLKLLDAKITDQDSRLVFLHEQEKSLQALLSSLNKPAPNTTTNTKSKHTSFAKRSGSLVWPIKGKLLARYGSSRNLGKLTWQGILISSPAGKNIIASAPGTVVFADWLRGFGLLVIIDHGDQYMTLYGNNETLLTQVGDIVNTGNLIAHSGDKGVRQHAGLYFEVRHKGSPTNPLKWLSKQS